jgi:hypothetical protein
VVGAVVLKYVGMVVVHAISVAVSVFFRNDIRLKQRARGSPKPFDTKVFDKCSPGSENHW